MLKEETGKILLLPHYFSFKLSTSRILALSNATEIKAHNLPSFYNATLNNKKNSGQFVSLVVDQRQDKIR